MRCKNMKPFILITLVLGLVSCELPVNKRPLIFSNNNWPPKSAKQLGPAPPGKQRTLVVQIRSDQPVPLVLKGRPGSHSHAHQHLAPHSHSSLSHGHGHAHLQHAHHAHLHSHPHSHAHAHLLQGGLPHNLRGSRPLKLSAPVYLKHAGSIRKPLKIKLSNSKLPAKPTFGYEKPFKYEKPSAVAFSELQNLPLDTHNNFNNEHFAPIYTVPAPNLALHDNQLDEGIDSAYLPPQHTTRPATQSTQRPQSTYYSVHEDETNDLTIRDPISGSQKFFAPDPDPSLPTSKVKVATESFNTPSNKKPLPADVQSNHLPAQPLVQIVGAQSAAQTVPVPIYPIQFAQQQTTQPFIAAAAHIPIYNPTYLVTQSNQLYSQHKQQLFKPSTEHVIETGYVNADLTQEVASNGQILQAAKDPHHQIHPVLDTAPQYAALIAAPALGESTEPVFETASFHLPNVAAVASSSPEGGFVVSNYYGNAHDSSQLLQAYAEEEAQRQQLETEHAAFELQKQHQLQQQQNLQEQLQQQNLQEQLQQQQQQIHLEALHAQAQQQYQQEQQQQQQYQQELQQHQQQQQQQQQQYQQELHLEELKAQAHEQHLQQQQQQQQIQLQQLQQQHQQLQQQQPQQHAADPAAAAFEEHQRLVQQQLGSNTPLRIFVPDEETAETQRLQKRSDNLKKGTFEDVPALDVTNATKDLFPVSTSVEVTGGQADVSSK